MALCSNHIIQAARERVDDILEINKEFGFLQPPVKKRVQGHVVTNSCRKREDVIVMAGRVVLNRMMRGLHSTKFSVLESQSMCL